MRRATPAAAWCAVVPQKALATAKGRLELDPRGRRALAESMLHDTVAAVTATASVHHLLILLDEPGDLGTRPPGQVVAAAGLGLNGSIARGAGEARRRFPGHDVVVVPADLPALDPRELETCLERAAGHPRGYLPDLDGSGTTILTATGGAPMRPAYGVGSARLHADGGARMIDPSGVVSLRTDVDDLSSLAAALALGCGPRTTACVWDLALESIR